MGLGEIGRMVRLERESEARVFLFPLFGRTSAKKLSEEGWSGLIKNMDMRSTTLD